MAPEQTRRGVAHQDADGLPFPLPETMLRAQGTDRLAGAVRTSAQTLESVGLQRDAIQAQAVVVAVVRAAVEADDAAERLGFPLQAGLVKRRTVHIAMIASSKKNYQKEIFQKTRFFFFFPETILRLFTSKQVRSPITPPG